MSGFTPSTRHVAALAFIVRLAAYATIIGLALELVVRGAGGGAIDALVTEDGPLEIAQATLAFTAAAIFAAARRAGARRVELPLLLACASLFAGVRELDGFFGVRLGSGAYRLFEVPVFIAAAAIAWRSRRSLLAQVSDFVFTPPALLLFAGAVVVLVHAQVLGQKELWQAIVSGPSSRIVKKTVEECSELTGYFLIFFAAIEVKLAGRTRWRADSAA